MEELKHCEISRDVSPGDWVNTYESGIWRVSRVVSNFFEFRYSLDQPKVASSRTLVFANRVVNSKWKRSFSSNCCEVAWVSPVSGEDGDRVRELLESDSRLRKAFEAFEKQTKPVDAIVNLGFGPIPQSSHDLKVFCSEHMEAQMLDGLTLDQVLKKLKAAGLDVYMGSLPIIRTLQLVSPNHELRDREFVLRRYRLLAH